MRIGWIGTGVMGASMAGHLLAAGHELTVHTRTRRRAEPLLERGARWAEAPGDAARGAAAVFSIVGFPADVEAVHLGPGGTLAQLEPGAVLVDMTTSRPALAVRLAEAAAARGVAALDAPVSGGDVGARNAALSIMVGGDAEALERVRPLLERMGSRIVHHGGPGTGQHAKVVNQILVAAGMLGVCEALVYADAAGLDASRAIESVSGGAAGSWAVSNLAPRIVRGDFAPGFFVEHFLKDLGIALEEADRLGLDLPGLALARTLYERVGAAGHGRSGTQALYHVVAGARRSRA